MRALRYLAVALLLTLPAFSFGWGGEGHQIVALIAEKHLSPAIQQQIKDLLDGAEISDAEIANWADQIRNERLDTRAWHYVNIPLEADGFDRKRDANHGDNVIDKITDFSHILADKSKPKKDRAEALKFLVHFVGDLHQPLHCAERNHDKGGQDVMLDFPGQDKPCNLHFVWDTLLIRQYIDRGRIADYAYSIDARIPAKSIDDLSKGTPIDWANESRAVAAKYVYAGFPQNSSPQRVEARYIEGSKVIVEQQLARGGLRLAAILKTALDGK